jgi:hypothetical protein
MMPAIVSVRLDHIKARLGPHTPAACFGLASVGLMLVWAVHNGGYDSETWYWGALASLGLLAAAGVLLAGRIRITRGRLIILGLFSAYVAWCYLSMIWAQSPGNALDGANQALLYLLVFAVMLLVPWTAQAGFIALAAYVIGVGVIGVVLLFRLAAADHVTSLVIHGRLAAPTGYINATAALFTIDALAATALAARRELPGLVRGLLFALACSSLQLAVIVQSRGWLFTLPLVGVAAIFVVADRLRVVVAAILPIAATLVLLHRLLAVFQTSATGGLNHASSRAGQAGLLVCAVVFVVGTLLAWADSLWPLPPLSPTWRRVLGTAVATLAVAGLAGAGTYATHGHPFHFLSRQWNGFSHVEQNFSTQSHFGDVGTSRYDFWRVALDAALAHPVQGLGEDNFADYYVKHRRTSEEPSWTHSIELRLLAQTGIVGFVLFAAFMVGALWLAARARLRGPPAVRGLVGVALLPLVVWLIHGSLDWFWEIPALSGPALGFLAMGSGLEATVAGRDPRSAERRPRPRPFPRWGAIAAGGAALVAGVIVLGFPYLSIREVSLATDSRQPATALRDLARAADLNPLSANPGRLAGVIALQNGQYAVAQNRFRQSIDREPGGWLAWLGAGLAASAMGQRTRAHSDFKTAYAINSRQPAVVQALRRVYTKKPLTSAEAIKLFIIVQ